ncbi:hypothetical protein KC352_g20108 [Hortaea werneckii]|nr:hypothetical protein KC352_g20108 [Hortaea werneckii]
MVGDQGTGSGAASPSATGGEGGLFSGPGGALRNNTRKGRPAPAVQTNDVVDENAFKSKSPPPLADGKATPLTAAPTGRDAKGTADGFEDDAWDVKPARSATPAAAPAPEAAKPATEQPRPPPAAQNDDLSLLAMPLQPQPTAPQQPAASPAPVQSPPPSQQQQQQQQQQPQPTQQQGADQALFDKIAALKPQPTAAPPRQRPAPPPALQQQQTGPLAPPPRAASAPGFQNPQQSGGFAPPPLQPQLTGYMPQPQQGMQTGAYGGYGGMPPQQPQGFPQQQQAYPQQQQQGYPTMQPQPTGMAFQPQSSFGQAAQGYHYGGFTGGMPGGQGGIGMGGMGMQQPPQPNYQQQLVNGAQTGSPFADPSMGGIPGRSFTPVGGMGQPTGMGMGMGMNGTAATGGFQAPPPQQQQPQLPPQQTGGVFGPGQALQQPLQPQKTGPVPPVRFGVTGGQAPLQAQPTGRANLAKATPQNPFGF